MNCGTAFDFSSFSSGTDIIGAQFPSRDAESFLHMPTALPPSSHIFSNQGAYMQQELSAVKERCNVLERQLLKTTIERDTIKSLFDQLSARVNVQPSTPTVKTHERYPNIRFWCQEAYAKWTTTAEASKNDRWKLAYLEDETGEMISVATLRSLRKSIKSAWKDLAINKNAPKKWGQASASARDYVHTVVYKAFAFMELAENDWKIEELCSLDYPGWVRNNSDGQGNWVDAKLIKSEDDSSTGGEQSSAVAVRKRKAKGSNSERAEKKVKGESDTEEGLRSSEQVDSPAPASSETESSSAPTPSSPSPVPLPSINTSLDVFLVPAPKQSPQTAPKPAKPSEKDIVIVNEDISATDEGVSGAINEGTGAINKRPDAINEETGATSEGVDAMSGGEIDARDDGVDVMSGREIDAKDNGVDARDESEGTGATSEGTGATSEGTGATSEGTGATSEGIGATNSTKTVIINPLGMLAKSALKIKIPPIPPMLIPERSPKDEEGAGKADGNIAQDKTKGRKMRVAKNKTAYNLCARRWLKQINETGTNEEFRHYWFKVLKGTQQDAYKRECAKLIAKDAWTNEAFNGTIY